MRWLWFAIALTAWSPGVFSAAEPKPEEKTRTYTITIEGMAYSPARLAVHRGDRIVWVNHDLFPHTATAAGKQFDSGSIAQGAQWTFLAKKAGDYPYGCLFHPTMHGEIEVR